MTGAVFILVGALGFGPAITVNTGDLEFAGDGSQALLLGLFQISVLHNAVHLLYGLAGIVLAATAPAARSYLIIGGLVYLLLWMYGLLVPDGSAADFLPLNGAGNWLHLALGLAMTVLARTLPPRIKRRSTKAH